MNQVQELITLWRNRAEEARDLYAIEFAARAYEKAAEELEERLAGTMMELLTLEEAEVESGYTRSHLRRLMREGTIPNAGNDIGPMILRAHVPRKPGYTVAKLGPVAASSRMQAARAVASGEE